MGDFSPNLKFNIGSDRLPSLILPTKDGQRDGTLPRRFASIFTRKRELADTQAELLSVLVPLTKIIEDSKTSSVSANAVPQTQSPSETKPKRKKRVRLKTERRREQCRNNQARYRDRQRGFVRELEERVRDLHEEIQDLTKERHTLCYGIQTKNNLWNIVVEYFRLFRYGFLTPIFGPESVDMENLKDQEYFLRAAMAEDVALGELSGVDDLIDQWQRYSSYFGKLYLHLNKMEQQPQGAMKADATLSFTITEATLRFVFPHLLDGETVHEDEQDAGSAAYVPPRAPLVGQRLHCPCSVRFSWDDAVGRVTQLEATVDLLSPLLRELGDLELVSFVLEKALITPEYLIGTIQR
ncbi:bZIP transcription factor 1 [Phytophthora citrophthora]|uniref:BZIP transcription factor 1 n=1 Tax=Phytophthora citrophthora TaxID=4793 RepID=A0AAD9G1Y0_9STRA|nr:bZIP transcription factor 1 [Phytophthora citrophthora]